MWFRQLSTWETVSIISFQGANSSSQLKAIKAHLINKKQGRVSKPGQVFNVCWPTDLRQKKERGSAKNPLLSRKLFTRSLIPTRVTQWQFSTWEAPTKHSQTFTVASSLYVFQAKHKMAGEKKYSTSPQTKWHF